jgi:hypothetical protein
MTGKLDWKWILYGVAIMFVLNLAAGVILAFFLGSQIEAVSRAEIALSGSQVLLLAVLNFLAFAIGGYIVGLKSAGRTILEPGISAAIAVTIGLLISGNLTILNIVAGAVVPFLAGMFGGWLGERRQATPAS